jgi:hypothetical protein
MKYPFYKHHDIKILYIFIALFAVGFTVSLFYKFMQGFILSVIGFFALLIVLIGHEIIIVLLDIKKKLVKS